MSPDPPLPGTVIETTPYGARYRLPHRPLGLSTLAGAACVFIGVLLAGMGAFWVLVAGQFWIHAAIGAVSTAGFGLPPANTPNGTVLNILIVGMVIIFSVVSVALFGAGLFTSFVGCWIAFGRDEFELTSTHLRAVARVGPLRWSGRRARALFSQLTVRSSRHGPCLLEAASEGSKPFQLAWCYPLPWLDALARHLAGEWAWSGDGAPFRVVSESDDPTDECLTTRPLNARLVVERRAESVVITDPPIGVWRGSQGCLILCLAVGCGLTGLLTLLVSLDVSGLGLPREDEFVPPPSFLELVLPAPLWVASLGGVLVVLHRARRRVVLTVAGGSLSVTWSGLFGSQRTAWARRELVGISVDLSSPVRGANDDPKEFWFLTVRLRDGKDVRLITRREGAGLHPRAELEWAAAELREALAAAPGRDTADGH